MKILHIALRSIILHSSVIHNVGAGTNAGNNVAAATVADARVSVEEVERGFVSDGSKRTYHEKLAQFTFHLLDNNPQYLADGHREQLQQKDEADKRAAAKKKKKIKKESRTHVRDYLKATLKNLQPARDGQRHNSPIKIDGDGAITHRVVTDFMETKTNTVTVDRAAAEKYLADIKNGSKITDRMVVPGTTKVKLTIYQSVSTFSAIRSSIAYLYKLAGVERPANDAADIAKFMGGMKRVSQAAKMHLGLKLTEGKVAMPIAVYHRIAKKLFFSQEKEDIFAHLFLVLDWCLMKRAENCVTAKINHISFNEDALVFAFAKTKGNQTGDEFGPWHVYANPEAPHICPVLALARYLFCFPDALRSDAPLFEGTSQYNLYSSRFARLLCEMEGDLNGYEPSDFGSHSCRKGVATWVAAGCTVSPPIVSLCLRAGWSLGGVKDKYLFHENAGDQHVGRCASGLNADKAEFAVCRAHFDFSSLATEEERVEREEMIKEWLEDRLPSDITEHTYTLASTCFAAICFHYKWLNKKLHKKCILRNSPAFKDIPDDFLDVAVIAYPWTKTEYTPKLSGIPPHVTQLHEMKELKLKMDALQKGIMNEMKSEMDRRGFASTECNTKKITDAIATLGGMIQKMDSVSTAQPNSPDQETMRERLATFAMEDEDDNDNAAMIFDEDHDEDDENTETSDKAKQLHRERHHKHAMEHVKRRKLTMGSHHGCLTPLPSDWEFPSMTWYQLIENWFLGNKNDNLPPIVDLNSKLVKHCNKGSGNRMRGNMAAFMRIVEEEARVKLCWTENKREWTNESVRDMIDMIRGDFIKKYMNGNNRKCENSWSTVYVSMSRSGAFKKRKAAVD